MLVLFSCGFCECDNGLIPYHSRYFVLIEGCMMIILTTFVTPHTQHKATTIDLLFTTAIRHMINFSNKENRANRIPPFFRSCPLDGPPLVLHHVFRWITFGRHCSALSLGRRLQANRDEPFTFEYEL